ncbi:MAG: hypothetical protein HN348_13120 [Proteobacteria bacterium]|jgi:PPM family protein phosphatase|nr:hypothetical protein [Pseudomonadota bacterium]
MALEESWKSGQWSLGVGPLRDGSPHPSGKAEYPELITSKTPVGEHLRLEFVYRITGGRIFYIANNLGPKWATRKCWNCGNRYSPKTSPCCDFCFTPLRDLRMMVTERWDPADYDAFEQFARLRLDLPGLITPKAILRRFNRMLVVYHFNGEHLLTDEPAPLDRDRVIQAGLLMSKVLHALREHGVVLRSLNSRNVLVMADHSVRLFDLDVDAVHHRPVPDRNDTIRLCQLLLPYCAPKIGVVRNILEDGVNGKMDGLKVMGALAELAAQPPVFWPSLASALSNIGLVREMNEDRWTWQPLAKPMVLYVVADGMGGHDAGEVASKIACEVIAAHLAELPATARPKLIEPALIKAIKAASTKIREWGQANGVKPGTTVTAAVVSGRKEAVIAHCGDSRIYACRGSQVKRLTRDHNLAQDIMEAKGLSLEKAMALPHANILTSALGSEDEDLQIDTKVMQGTYGDRLLMCSDGLCGLLPDEIIGKILAAHKNDTRAVRSLVQAALERGAPDNTTVLLVSFAPE